MADGLRNLIGKVSLSSIQDIQKAIQYFPMIPDVERAQAVLRITNAIAILGEQVRVSKKNPITKYLKDGTYVEFVDWEYKHPKNIQFIIIPSYPSRHQTINSLEDYIDSMYTSEVLTDTHGNIMFDRIFNRSIDGGSVMALYRPDVYISQTREYSTKTNLGFTWYLFNNVVLNYCNKMVLSFMNDAGIDVYDQYLVNAYMLDMNEMIMREDSAEVVINAIHDYVTKLSYLPLEFQGIYNFMITKFDIKSLSDNFKSLVKRIEDRITNTFLLYDEGIKPIFGGIPEPNGMNHVHTVLISDGSNVVNVLESYKEIREKSLYANIDIEDTKFKKFIFQQSEAIGMREFGWLQDTLKYINTAQLDKFKKTMVNEDISFNIDLSKMYALKKSNIIKTFIQNSVQNFTFGCVKKTCYILGVKGDKVYMVPIFTGNENALIRRLQEMDKRLIVRVIEFKDNEPRDLMSTSMMVIESANKIEFDKDTNLKFTFRRTDKNTYMNRYSEIHNVLVQNSRNKNYEAMKTDLARLYALIYIIERDVTHSMKPVSPSVKADGTKARMFAKNDMKRYTDEVLAHDKTFDLSKHFAEAKIKEQIEKEYEVKINTLGVKKLLKTLI